MPTAIHAPALIRGQNERGIRESPRWQSEPQLVRQFRAVVDAPVAHQYAEAVMADERLALEQVLGSHALQLLAEARAAKSPDIAPVAAVVRQGGPHRLERTAGELVAVDAHQPEDRAHCRLRSQWTRLSAITRTPAGRSCGASDRS